MIYKTVLDYIKSLHRAEFDPCTLSVKGFAEEFQENKKHFGYDFFSFFFNHSHLISLSSIKNFLELIWVTENLKEALKFDDYLFDLCQNSDNSVADKALKIFDHASCESDIKYDYTKLLNLKLNNSWLRNYRDSIVKSM